MSEYIKQDKALQELHLNHKDVIYIDKQDAAERIRQIPSIDIVRCKECKHWHSKDNLTYCDRIDYGYGYKAEDFCSYGERRE